jgi:hypothetical protein
LKLVAAFEAKPIKEEFIICHSVGLLYMPSKEGNVFVLGKDQVISADFNISSDDVKKMKILWIGKEVANYHINEEEVDSASLLSLLNDLKEFHGINFGSVLLFIKLLRGAINIADYNANDINWRGHGWEINNSEAFVYNVALYSASWQIL